MSIPVAQFRTYALDPAMRLLAPFGPPVTQIASDLLAATFAQETHLGEWLHQDGGPGLGVGSIQPLTLANVLRTMPVGLIKMILPMAADPDFQVCSDLGFACVTARWNYWIQPNKLPVSSAPADLWPAYRDMWCKGCAATEAEFLANCAAYTDLG